MAIRRDTLTRQRQLAATVGAEVDDTVRAMTAQWVRQWDRLTPVWQRAIADMLAVADRLGRWPSPWQTARIDSVAAASLDTDTTLALLAAGAATLMAASVPVVVAATVAAAPLILASQLPATLIPDATIRYAARILPTPLDIIQRRVTERITALTRPLSAEASRAMRRELVRGVADGSSPDAVARRMLSGLESGFSGGLTRASVIARTELVDCQREADRYAHEALADVLSGWRWVCALDQRSCPACWAMHGTVHPVAEPGPLGHPNCRCQRLPVLKPWRELGIGGDEPDDLIPDARTRFDALPEADQLRVLGGSRLVLLRSGDIDWPDLAVRRTNRDWRDSYVPRTVADLRRIAALRNRSAA